ncbi:MAG: hypothetical protein AAF959_08255 [Cyanobacteria bacterium P01_D01_bin.56]
MTPYLLGLLTVPALYLARQVLLFLAYVPIHSIGYIIFCLLSIWSNREGFWVKVKETPWRVSWELYRSIAWKWPLEGADCIGAECVKNRKAGWVLSPPMGFRYVGGTN